VPRPMSTLSSNMAQLASGKSEGTAAIGWPLWSITAHHTLTRFQLHVTVRCFDLLVELVAINGSK
jgi:hypothetical protein